MTITVSEKINAPRERVWNLITDSDGWTDNISGIKSVEVLEKPSDGVIGLKWREKREFFGKEATETMWITAAETGHWYETNALNHGMAYTTPPECGRIERRHHLDHDVRRQANDAGRKIDDAHWHDV